ncbi:MAG: molecular chaperone TorD family protein [Bryobacteraceae bacterium]|nr:molecular chaperone TorD family protein [Bryobacteraceae bacterium]
MTPDTCYAVGDLLLEPPAGDEAAALDYARLFLSPQGAICPPWQSVQGDAPRLLGPPHHSALAWYRRYGFEPVTDSEPADHAGLLLLFYARLVELGEPPAVLDAFRREHLGWLAAFGKTLAKEARSSVYSEAGRLLQEA